MLSTWDTNEGCERLTDAKTKGAAYLPDLWSTMIDADLERSLQHGYAQEHDAAAPAGVGG